MTIEEALALGRTQLVSSSSPTLDVRLLLEHVLEVNHPYLVAHGDESLTPAQEGLLRDLLDRAARQEPIPYLVGQAPFFGLMFAVNPAVLIPRPETELLVESALDWAQGRDSLHVVDVGTGSGCIAIILASHLATVRVEATDISAAALAVAKANGKRHGVLERVVFHHGPLLEPITGSPNLIVANLPYVSGPEWTALPLTVKWYEPEIALKGGPDGLSLIRRLLEQAKSRLAVDGALFLEVGWQQGAAVSRLAKLSFPSARVDVLKDYSGLDRIVRLRLTESQ